MVFILQLRLKLMQLQLKILQINNNTNFNHPYFEFWMNLNFINIINNDTLLLIS